MFVPVDLLLQARILILPRPHLAQSIHSPFYFSVYTAPSLFACRKQQRSSCFCAFNNVPHPRRRYRHLRTQAQRLFRQLIQSRLCPSNASFLPAKDHADLTLTQKTSHKHDNAIVPHYDTTEWIITTNYHQYITIIYKSF